MTSNYYIKIGSDSYSFNAIFNAVAGGTALNRFYDNNIEVGTKYKNIIADDNLQIKHNNINYIYGTIDISQYLLPKFYEFTTTPTNPVTIPAWCTTIKAIIIGGGGLGGSAGSYEEQTYGGGGGGGGYCYISVSIVSSVTSFTCTVGSNEGGDNGNSKITYNNINYIGYVGGNGGNGGISEGEIGTGGSRYPSETSGNNGSDAPDENRGTGGFNTTDTTGVFNTTHQGIEGNSYGNGGRGQYYQRGSATPEPVLAPYPGYVRVYFIR